MNEDQAGHLQSMSLMEECSWAMSDDCDYADFLHYFPNDMPEEYAVAVKAVLSVLRRRQLITTQGLQIIKQELGE